jgi:hypothetical protein
VPPAPSANRTVYSYDEGRSDSESPGQVFANKGHLTTVRNGAGSIYIDYGDLGQPVRTAWAMSSLPVGGSDYASAPFKRQFLAPTGEVLYTRWPDGSTTGTSSSPLAYDPAGRLAAIPGLITAIAYEADGQTDKVVYANGVASNFSYDASRRWLTQVRHYTTAGTTLRQTDYVRDLAGRIVSSSGSGEPESWTYAYDTLDRLTSAVNAAMSDGSENQSFTYDGASNMLTQRGVGTYVNGASVGQNTADARTLPHATASVTVSGVTRRTFDYDLNGNQIGRRSYSSAGAEVPAQARTIVYDRENRPTQVTLGDTVAGDYVTTVALYGPDGERLRKDVKTTTDGVTTTTQSTWFLGPDVEYDATAGVWTKLPHADVRVVGTGSSAATCLGASRPAGLGDGGKRCHRQAGAGEALFALRSAAGRLDGDEQLRRRRKPRLHRRAGRCRNRPRLSPCPLVRRRVRSLHHPRLVGPHRCRRSRQGRRRRHQGQPRRHEPIRLLSQRPHQQKRQKWA